MLVNLILDSIEFVELLYGSILCNDRGVGLGCEHFGGLTVFIVHPIPPSICTVFRAHSEVRCCNTPKLICIDPWDRSTDLEPLQSITWFYWTCSVLASTSIPHPDNLNSRSRLRITTEYHRIPEIDGVNFPRIRASAGIGGNIPTSTEHIRSR
jgi:hypothetical protein